MMLALAPVASTAWRTVSKTGTPATVWPPLPGVTPATMLVPYSIICRAWNSPSRPVMPWTMSRVSLLTRMLISESELLMDCRGWMPGRPWRLPGTPRPRITVLARLAGDLRRSRSHPTAATAKAVHEIPMQMLAATPLLGEVQSERRNDRRVMGEGESLGQSGAPLPGGTCSSTPVRPRDRESALSKQHLRCSEALLGCFAPASTTVLLAHSAMPSRRMFMRSGLCFGLAVALDGPAGARPAR